MTLAWKSDLPAGRKMVLLALCDNANDQGECFPSVPMLAKKCSMGERTVQQHIADMEDAGILTREMRNGRSTIYHIDPRKFCTPADFAPPQISHPTPAESAPPPPQNLHPTPADFAPITIKEPSVEPSGKHQKRAKAAPVAFEIPAWVPPDAWDGYLEMRRKKRKEPTAYALRLVIADLDKFKAAGHDVRAILDASIKNGWTDVYEPKAAQARASPQSRNDRSGAAAAVFGTQGPTNQEFIDVN
jgi:DNA-binding transcriptional ArsR family regulator